MWLLHRCAFDWFFFGFMVHPGCLTWFGSGYGKMVGYRTFGADCYGQRSRPELKDSGDTVIPLSFQAFSPSLVTFGLAFANPSPQPFADPQVLASSWTTCRETAIWSQKQTATTHSISFSFGAISCSDERCEGKWSISKWAWLHFDTVTLLHGFRLSLGFKEHLSCIDVLPVGIHTAAFKNPKGFLPAKSHDCTKEHERGKSFLFLSLAEDRRPRVRQRIHLVRRVCQHVLPKGQRQAGDIIDGFCMLLFVLSNIFEVFF